MRDRVLIIVQLVLGTIITLAVIIAWCWGKVNGVQTTELMAFAVPIVGALFLVASVSKAADNAAAAAAQTNGSLEPRVEAAVASALSKRDAARTRQMAGDITEGTAYRGRQGEPGPQGLPGLPGHDAPGAAGVSVTR